MANQAVCDQSALSVMEIKTHVIAIEVLVSFVVAVLVNAGKMVQVVQLLIQQITILAMSTIRPRMVLKENQEQPSIQHRA